MPQDNTSLRGLIAKWFGPGDTPHLRITRLHSPGFERGCVQAELATSTGPLVIIFFRHQTGCWGLFPPLRVRAR
ncbi:hypothetical protein [Ralstonia pseudosolanacearum]|uniref:hypothetical protein n=1 Tax=Ralstonia pseudosolanacearum TaxID=1310165 RepID=UPI0018D05D19|nr:hypothetical protein [Ralstonia pseudosolanacearum]